MGNRLSKGQSDDEIKTKKERFSLHLRHNLNKVPHSHCVSLLPLTPMSAAILSDLPIGSVATIKDIPVGHDEHITRLRELGLVPGTKIRLVRRAPLGDPLEISVRGSRLAIRRSEARHIQIFPEQA
jgi:Fe2+ transport system protein FeoA